MSYNSPDDPRSPSRYPQGPQGVPSGYRRDAPPPEYRVGNMSGMSGGRPPSQPERLSRPEREEEPRSRRGLIIGLIIAALVVVVLGAAAGGVYAYGTNQAKLPLQAANNFCAALKAQDYSGAYAQFSSSYKASVTADQFKQLSGLQDQVDGKVKACSVSSPASSFTLDFGSTSQSFAAVITRNKAFSGALGLVKENGKWLIGSVQASLQGTDVAPIALATQFCTALVAKKYDDAYADFSTKRQQAIGSKTDYSNGLKAAFGTSGVSLADCQPQLNSFAVAEDDSTASLTVTLQVKVSTSSGSQTQAVPLKVSFVKESGAWKIDDAEVAG